MIANALKFGKGFASFLERHGLAHPDDRKNQGLVRPNHAEVAEHGERLLLSVVGVERLAPLFASLFDESRFLSPYGLRSLSAVHRDKPYVLHLEGTTATIDYEPAESTTGMFGGNSNWRGPIWFPLNYLVISCLLKYHNFFGEDFTVEYPTGSGNKLTLAEIADDLGGGSSRSSPGARTGGGPATAGWTSCSTTRSGGTTSTSTSTTTAITGPGSAPATRPGGPG